MRFPRENVRPLRGRVRRRSTTFRNMRPLRGQLRMIADVRCSNRTSVFNDIALRESLCATRCCRHRIFLKTYALFSSRPRKGRTHHGHGVRCIHTMKQNLTRATHRRVLDFLFMRDAAILHHNPAIKAMHYEYMHAEYQQRRKARFQWLRKAAVVVLISAQVLIVSGLLYLTCTE